MVIRKIFLPVLLILFFFISCVVIPGPSEDPSLVKDIDGNVYKTVKIGDQWWMAENLKVTHYLNGEAIAHVTDSSAWSNLSSGAYCEYGNNSSNVSTYGRLYNWYAVDDSRGLAPAGWHVSTYSEWQTLIDFLGGDDVAGGKMKETGTTHWTSPNTGATNESGFTALPGGVRGDDGPFYDLKNKAFLWSSLDGGNYDGWFRVLSFDISEIHREDSHKRSGFSVRCVMD